MGVNYKEYKDRNQFNKSPFCSINCTIAYSVQLSGLEYKREALASVLYSRFELSSPPLLLIY